MVIARSAPAIRRQPLLLFIAGKVFVNLKFDSAPDHPISPRRCNPYRRQQAAVMKEWIAQLAAVFPTRLRSLGVDGLGSLPTMLRVT
ncbi:hypothetical protein MLPF_3352 [Mycobacterium lepromatosis]|nr:hypothetical protein MLPF_3352 [Mycobacterium lepromatosis]